MLTYAVPPLEKATSQDLRRPPASVPLRTAGTVGGLLGDDLSLSQVLHTSAYVSIRQHQHTYAVLPQLGDDLSLSQVLLIVYGALTCIRHHTLRQHTLGDDLSLSQARVA